MVQIQNTDAINAIRDGARLSISEGFPQELGKTCVPVMDMTPDFHNKVNIVRNAANSTSGSATIYTTPTDLKFYLCGLKMFIQEDATSNNTATYINITVDGATRTIASIDKLTTTATTHSISLDFNYPILISENTAITLNNSFTLGSASKSANIWGYTVAK